MSQNATPWIDDPNGPTNTEKSTGMWIHLCMLFNCFVPLLPMIAAIVVWRVNAAKSDFVNRHGWAAANLMISNVIYGVIFAAVFVGLSVIATGMSEENRRGAGAMLILGVIATWVISLIFWLINLITAIIGAVRASSGQPYRYFHAFPLVVPS